MSHLNQTRRSAILLAGAALALPTFALAAPAPAIAFKVPPSPSIAMPSKTPNAEPGTKPVILPTAQRPVVRPAHKARRVSGPSGPALRVLRANADARIQPSKSGYANAVQSYAYAPGELYQLYAAPGHITDIMLEEGEQLTGTGPVAAGDTTRWIIGATTSGTGSSARIHILVKPTREGLSTNLIINTDRRTYHLELKSSATIWMASIAWDYPQDLILEMAAMARGHVQAEPVASGIDATALRFGYSVDGDKPDWRPAQVFDDGRRTYIAFPTDIAAAEMPPLFVISASGELELINTRIRGTWLIADRLFERAELRLGTGKSQAVVRISAPKRKGRK